MPQTTTSYNVQRRATSNAQLCKDETIYSQSLPLRVAAPTLDIDSEVTLIRHML